VTDRNLLYFDNSREYITLYNVQSLRSHLVQMWTDGQTVKFYYRAMHFSAKRGIAIACRLSVCL